MSKQKIAFIMDGFSPYRVPLWRELGQHVELHVILLSEVETGRSWSIPDSSDWNFSLHVADGIQIYVRRMDWALNLSYLSVRQLLEKLAPDALVIGGWSSPGNWAALFWARSRRRPAILWMESNTLSSRARGSPLIDAVKRGFVSRCGAYYAFGDAGRQYIEELGGEGARVVTAFNLPDIARYPSAERLCAYESMPVLLYAGQFIERKGVGELVPLLSAVSDLPWKLLLVGDGPLRASTLEALEAKGFADRMVVRGHLQETEMTQVYRAADILLFPSRVEVWGMVVHEALLSGVYVIGSSRAASSHALIQGGLNGEIVDFSIPGVGAGTLRRSLLRTPFNRAQIRSSVSGISFETEVTKMLVALELARQ